LINPKVIFIFAKNKHMKFLIQRIGGEAIQQLKEILMCCVPDDAYIIERIVEKDCKIGYGTRMINKVFPDLIEKSGGKKILMKGHLEKEIR
jgi:hypothetical protein